MQKAFIACSITGFQVGNWVLPACSFLKRSFLVSQRLHLKLRYVSEPFVDSGSSSIRARTVISFRPGGAVVVRFFLVGGLAMVDWLALVLADEWLLLVLADKWLSLVLLVDIVKYRQNKDTVNSAITVEIICVI